MNIQMHVEKFLRRPIFDRKPRRPAQAAVDSTTVLLLLAKQRVGDLDFHAARAELIRVAAYYRAEKRGFVPGAELDDWLAAEAELDARLNE
jgi:hypothetical protein